jgi:hypothetical protein
MPVFWPSPIRQASSGRCLAEAPTAVILMTSVDVLAKEPEWYSRPDDIKQGSGAVVKQKQYVLTTTRGHPH